MTDIKKWKFIRHKILLDHPRMHLSEDRVMLPNNKEIDYLRIMPVDNHAVAVIAINQKNEILLQREYSYPPNEIMWQLPGGGMESGESIEVAALRELSEESNITATLTEVIGFFYANNRRSDQKQYVVVCRDLKDKPGKADQEEFIESKWLGLEEINKLISTGEIVNMNLLAALHLFEKTYLSKKTYT